MPTATSTSTLPATATYADAYARLAAIAAKLKAPASAGSIDTLAQDVRDARAAYAICKDRIEAIRAELEAERIEISEAGITDASHLLRVHSQMCLQCPSGMRDPVEKTPAFLSVPADDAPRQGAASACAKER